MVVLPAPIFPSRLIRMGFGSTDAEFSMSVEPGFKRIERLSVPVWIISGVSPAAAVDVAESGFRRMGRLRAWITIGFADPVAIVYRVLCVDQYMSCCRGL